MESQVVPLGEIHWATSLRARLMGLMGDRHGHAALALAPCKDVHTFGMKRPIDIAFVREDGTVAESQRNVGRSERLRVGEAAFVIEREHDPNAQWPEAGDRIELAFRKTR